jgi:hypothetical protein
LASLLVLVAVAGYACKRILDHIRLHSEQLNIVAEIMDRDRTKIWSELSIPSSAGSGGTFVDLGMPQGRTKELADWMGLPYKADVVSITLRGDRFSWERTMGLVARLPKLKHLWIAECEVTEPLIELIAEMDGLERVEFTNTTITEEMGLALKEALPNARITAYVDARTPAGLRVAFELP